MPIFDVSGVDGASGTSGNSRDHSTASGGQHGRSGGHGTDGQHGTSASNIAVQLTTPTTTANIPKNVVLANPIDVDVKLDTSIISTAGQLQKKDTILKINSGELMSFHALGGHGGNGGNGGNGQHGGKGYGYGAFLYSHFDESISEYAWRTGDQMQLAVLMVVLMAVLVATEEMVVTLVKVVMVDREELFESLFRKPTLISLCSMVPRSTLVEEEVQKGNQGLEVSHYRIIFKLQCLACPLSEINFSIRFWGKRWGRRLVISRGRGSSAHKSPW